MHLPHVKIPRVLWDYTRKSVLTMELEEALVPLSSGTPPQTVTSLLALPCYLSVPKSTWRSKRARACVQSLLSTL